MRKYFLFFLVLIPLFSFPAFSAENISVQNMIGLKNLDFSEEDIKKQIDQSDAPYTLTNEEKQTLKQAGFSDLFIQYVTDFKPGAKSAAAPAAVPEKKEATLPPSEQKGNPLPSALPPGLPETGGAPPPLDNASAEAEPAPTPSDEEAVSSDEQNYQNDPNTDSAQVQTNDPRVAIVGTWKATLYYQGSPNGMMTVQFYPNGNYSSFTQYGYQQMSVTGIYEVQNETVSGRTQMGQYFSYPYSLNSNQLVMVMPEWGGQVFFFRQ